MRCIMYQIMIVFGVLISILSVIIIIFDKKNRVKLRRGNSLENYDMNELELQYRNLKNDIMDLTKEFNRTANYNTNLMDEKILYMNEIRDDLDNKLFKATKLITDIEIMCNRLEKINSRLDNGNTDKYDKTDKKEYRNDDKVIKMPRINRVVGLDDQIEDCIERGMDLAQISELTGKSIGELEFIIRLKNKR